MIRSLRERLLVSTSIAIAVVLSLLGFTIYFSMARSMQSEFDAALMTQARELAAMAEQNGKRVHLEFDPQQMPEFMGREHPEYFQAWLDDGRVLSRSASLSDRDLPGAKTGSAPVFQDVSLRDGQPGRSLTLWFTPRVEDDKHDVPLTASPHTARVTVARETAVLVHALSYLRWLLICLFAAAICVSGAVLVSVVERAIGPVKQLAEDIEALAETTLSQRIKAGSVPLELMPVVEKLNGLLSRLEAAFSREKAFTADVAHELRTPLAGLQTTLEVCRSRTRNPEEYVRVIDDCREMTDRMQAMVEGLLLLARADAGQLPVEKRTLDLSLLLDECWAPFQHRADQRHLNVERQTAAVCAVKSDADKLRIIINNLFDNAVSYANEGGVVRIASSAQNGHVSLEVSNTGSSLNADEAKHLFERFWRGDSARADTGLHCGLGLSLCQRLTSLLNGTIDAQATAEGKFIAKLTLNRAN